MRKMNGERGRRDLICVSMCVKRAVRASRRFLYSALGCSLAPAIKLLMAVVVFDSAETL